MGEKSSAVRTSLIAAGTAAIAAVVTVFAVGALGDVGRDIFGNTETAIRLRPNALGACELFGKETGVIVKKGKRIKWEVENLCPATQTVTLGNFRKEAISLKDNCNDAMVGTFEWPFEPGPELANRQSVVPSDEKSDKVKFKAKDLPGTYYFDVCLGNVKVDPRLIIDP
jgi:hypothetical protein